MDVGVNANARFPIRFSYDQIRCFPTHTFNSEELIEAIRNLSPILLENNTRDMFSVFVIYSDKSLQGK
jgi:hypothetical protein